MWHSEGSMLATIVILLAATVILVPLCKRLRLGSVLGYLLAGIVLGPFGLGLFEGGAQLSHASELGIALLLFLVGLELDPERLWALRRSIVATGGAQIALTAALLTPLLVLGVFPGVALAPNAAVLVACALAMSSTAFVLQQLGERGELVKRYGRGAFGILLAQDLAVIPLLAVLPVVVGNAGGFRWSGLLRGALALAAVILGGKHLVRPLFRWVSGTKSPEVFSALTLLLALGTALLLERVGLSLSLGAFLAGVLLATSEYRHELHSNIEPFESLLMGLFFVTVGVDTNLRVLLRDPVTIVAGALLLVAVKASALWCVGPIARLAGEERFRLALALAQGGEFAFVLFGAAVAAGVVSLELRELLQLVVTTSMAMAPLLFVLADVLAPRLFPKKAEEEFDRIDEPAAPVIVAGFGRVGQIVCRVLRMTHHRFVALDKSHEQVDFVRKFGSKLYYGDATRLELLRAAGAEKARALVVAIDEIEASVTLVAAARRHFPNLAIIARARNRVHAYRLLDLGVQTVFRETFSSSLEMAESTLGALGFDEGRAKRAIEIFREHDERTVRAVYALHRDEKALQAMAQEYGKELERIFVEDAAVVSDGETGR